MAATFRQRVGELNAELTLETAKFSGGLDRAEGLTRRTANNMSRELVRADRRWQASLQNTSFQIADIAVQLEAGTNPARVFAQQGSQIAAAWGPAGAVIGALIATAVAAGPALLNMADATKEANESIDDLRESLEELNRLIPDSAVNVGKLIEAFDKARGQGRNLFREGLGRSVKETELQLLQARRAVADYAGEIEKLIRANREAFRFTGDPSQRLPVTVLPEDRQNILDQLDVLEAAARRFRQTGEAEPFRNTLQNIQLAAERAGQSLGNFLQPTLAGEVGELSEKSFEAATALVELENAFRNAQRAATVAARGVQLFNEEFGPPEPPESSARELVRPPDISGAVARAQAQLERIALPEARATGLEDLASDFAALEAAIDPSVAAAQRLLEIQRQIAQAIELGVISQERGAELYKKAEVSLNRQDDLFQGLSLEARTFSSGLARALVTSDDLGEAFERIAQQIAESVIEAAIFAAIMASVGGEATGGLAGAFFELFSRQHGGRVDPTRTYLVGEAGPELFVPDTAGRIVSNSALRTAGGEAAGGGGVHIDQLVVNGGTPGSAADVANALANGVGDLFFDQIREREKFAGSGGVIGA